MPRPQKCRKVCCLPKVNSFVPAQNASRLSECVVLSVDEYEALRLIDNEGLNQEECGQYMKIARTTVQQVYNNARKKLAKALVNGLAIKIEGGSYRLCEGKEAECGRLGCCRHKHNRRIQNDNRSSG